METLQKGSANRRANRKYKQKFKQIPELANKRQELILKLIVCGYHYQPTDQGPQRAKVDENQPLKEYQKALRNSLARYKIERLQWLQEEIGFLEHLINQWGAENRKQEKILEDLAKEIADSVE